VAARRVAPSATHQTEEAAMPVLMLFEVPGATMEQYGRINDHLGIHGDEDAPDGLILHVAADPGDGLLIIDVWESEEAMGRFVQTRLLDALKAAGIPEAQPRVLPVHNLIAQGQGKEAGVAMLVEIDDFGPDQYDRMIGAMDAHVSDGSAHPAVSHVAAVTPDGGMVVADLWESPEAFARFAETQIGPAGAAAGLGAIEPRFVPVHNRLRGRRPAAA
jgi:hypothetical protein